MEREQSEFNMAVAWLQSIRELQTVSNISAMQLDAFGWYHALMTIMREESPLMKPDERVEYNTKFRELREKVTRLVELEKRRGIKQLPPEIHEALHEIDIGLRDVLKASGLLTRFADDASKALK